MGHVVVVPFPAQGHITPLMEFAHKLSLEEGFVLTIVNTTHNHKLLLQSADRSAGLPSNIRLASVSDGLPPDHPRTSAIAELCRSLQASMAPSLISLLLTGVDEEGNRFDSPPFTCLVCDLSLAFGEMVADTCKLPRVAFWTRSASYFAATELICKGFWRAGRAASDLSSHIPGAPSIAFSDMSSVLLVDDPLDFMFNFVINPVAGASKASWILFNTFADLETPVVNALAKDMKVATIGPISPADFSNDFSRSRVRTLSSEAHDCIEWLDNKPPNSVLYISFGSIATLSEMAVQELAYGLELSNHFCLWVTRPDLVETGRLKFLVEFQKSVKERVLCVAWAPQLRVLLHTAVRGFLTHGGWNSVMEAIAAGVPMLGWPYGGADQRANCKCFVDGWRVGLYLEKNGSGMVTRQEVQEKVRLLMDDGSVGDKLRERAVDLRNTARRAISQGGSSRRNWDALVNGIRLMKFSA